jgi:hypothetical protein
MIRSNSISPAVLFGTLFCAPIAAQVTQRVSVDSGGIQGNEDSDGWSISADGRFVAFESYASNLVPGDANGTWDVFVRDRISNTTTLISVNSAGRQGNDRSEYPSISADGRFVAFRSFATNLVPNDMNGVPDVFLHDRQSGVTTCVSVSSGGAHGNAYSDGPSVSADGRFVAFYSGASNLVPGDTNENGDVFVRDLLSGTTELVSISSSGAQGDNWSWNPSISGDGRFVAFQTRATNLVPGDTNASEDIMVHDRISGTTTRVSVNSAGVQGNGNSRFPSISSDGRHVCFLSEATNLVTGDTNGSDDVFVHDLQSSITTRVSVNSAGQQGNSQSFPGQLSADGRYVAFSSLSTNLVPGDTNGFSDGFVRDRRTGMTARVTVSWSGGQVDDHTGADAISADGRFVVLGGRASNLVQGDTNGVDDAFVRDLQADGFVSLCDPGTADVMPCPCSNPPSDLGRGCDNSAGTGGAALSASGIAYLSVDSLALTTSGETPNALSVVMQGNGAVPAGVVYGQGVRCVGGTIIRRLFIKQAVAGSITAPNFAAGDPPVSARSAAKGDVIQPGQSRWYLVYYRDPVVLGGCPASATFNATQTGQVTWWP